MSSIQIEIRASFFKFCLVLIVSARWYQKGMIAPDKDLETTESDWFWEALGLNRNCMGTAPEDRKAFAFHFNITISGEFEKALSITPWRVQVDRKSREVQGLFMRDKCCMLLLRTSQTKLKSLPTTSETDGVSAVGKRKHILCEEYVASLSWPEIRTLKKCGILCAY